MRRLVRALAGGGVGEIEPAVDDRELLIGEARRDRGRIDQRGVDHSLTISDARLVLMIAPLRRTIGGVEGCLSRVRGMRCERATAVPL